MRDRRRLTHPPAQGSVVLVLALAGLTSPFMFTLVVPVQAQLPGLLHASRADTAWVMTATLVVAAISTPISGRLGDMYGKRRILLALLCVMVAGSIVAAVSAEIGGVLVGRALQGAVAGAVPLGISIARDVLHPDRIDAAIAVISATLGAGGAIALPIGALIAEYADWHLLFWVAAFLGAVIFVLVLLVVPPSVLRAGGRFNLAGAAGLAVGLTGSLIAVSRANDWGWTSPAVLACGIGGLVVLIGWGWQQLRTASPLLDLRIARRPAVLLTNLASVALGFALFASNVIYPQMLEIPKDAGGFGLSLVSASLVVMPAGLVTMLVSPLSGALARRTGPKVLLASGSLALLAAYMLTILWSGEVWHILTANLVIGLGIGLGFAAMPMLIMRAVPPAETGESNGLNALARSLGTSLAGAVIGAVLAGYTVDIGAVPTPTPVAFHLSLIIGAAAAAASALISILIPPPPPSRDSPSALPD